MSRRNRSAKDGRFIDKETARANPETTVSEKIAPSYIQDRIDWVTKPPTCETHDEKFIYEYDDTTMSRYCRSCDRDEASAEVAPIGK